MELHMIKESTNEQTYPVWNTLQMYIATLIGGPPAGCYLISQNYKALNNPQYAKYALWSGILGMGVIFFAYTILAQFFPDFFAIIPRNSIGMGTCVAVLAHANISQKKAIKALLQAGNPRGSYFKLLLAILVSLFGMLALAVGLASLSMYFFE